MKLKKLLIIALTACLSTTMLQAQPNETLPPANAGPVICYGELQVAGRYIVGAKTENTPVQVKGVSFFWSTTGWGAEGYFNANSVNAMVDLWGTEVVRVPLGVETEDSSLDYFKDPKANLDRVRTVIEAAIAKDVYVIIDWHSHHAHHETAEAKAFFSEMAQMYGKYDNIIFELYNEPKYNNYDATSGFVNWSTIKAYADEITAEIRKYSDNLILVGTPVWSQQLSQIGTNAVNDPANNTAYVLHFYSGTHSLNSLKGEIQAAHNNNLAVFITEWGSTTSDGAGAHYEEETQKWHQYLDEEKISSAVWAMSNGRGKNNASLFTDYFDQTVPENFTKISNLTHEGEFVYNMLQEWKSKAAWRKNCEGCEGEVHLVTFNNTGGMAVLAQAVRSGAQAIEPVATKDYVAFAGWYLNGTAFNFSTPITADIELEAHWEQVLYTVTFDSNGGESMPNQTVLGGELLIKPENPTHEEFTFAGWTLNNKHFDFNTPIGGNITLVAQWAGVAPECDNNILSDVALSLGTVKFTPNWTPSNAYTAQWENDEFAIQLNAATTLDWQAQFPLVCSAQPLVSGKTYTLSFDISTSIDLPHVHLRVEKDGVDGHHIEIPPLAVIAGSRNVNAAFTNSGATLITEFNKLVFDFGGNPAGANIVISNIVICTDETIIPVQSVVLNKTAVELSVGASEQLTQTVAPADATNTWVTWLSSDPKVATVVNGKITAISAGTATITVTTNNGNKTETCEVTVTPTTGIDDISANEIFVFPNPTKGELTVSGNVETWRAASLSQTIEIYDNAGRNVGAYCIRPNNTINISHLPNGIYFIQINGKQVKIVKQ